MRIWNRLALAAFACLLGSSGGAHAKDVLLRPSTPWNIDYGVERCQLGRTFGEGADAVTFYLQKMSPGLFFDLSIAGERLGEPRRAFGLKIDFSGLEPRRFDNSVWITAAADGRSVLLAGQNSFGSWNEKTRSFDPPSKEVLHGISTIAVQIPKMDRLVLQTGPMDAPSKALDSCMDALVRSWGFDPDVLSSLSRRAEPIGDTQTWIDPRTYPDTLRRDGEGAIIDFRLSVDREGHIEDCTIQSQVGSEKFAKVACDQLSRNGRFKPALDAEGRPVRTLWFNRARFQS